MLWASRLSHFVTPTLFLWQKFLPCRRCLLQASKCVKIVFDRGFYPDPTGVAYRAPADPLLVGRGLAGRHGQSLVFTAQCYATAALAMALCPSVCPSVTSRCSTKTAKRRITQITPHDTPKTLVFWRQRSPQNSTMVTPYGDRHQMQVEWVKIGDFRQITGYISKTVGLKDRHIVSIKVE